MTALGKMSLCAAVILAWPCIAAHADPYDSGDSRNQSISVSVSYTFTLPAETGTAAVQSASELGRRQAYEMAGRECANLLATIAESCSLANINVSSQPQRVYGQQSDGINIRLTASFKITPKAQLPSEPFASQH